METTTGPHHASPGRAWVRRSLPTGAVVILAVAVAAFAFILRFNALGGALAGFDNDDFNTLTRADLVRAGEQPLRDLDDSDLRDAWPSLTYELPAWAQRIGGDNLLPYGVLTCGALAVSAAVVLLLARALSGSVMIAVLTALAVVLSAPRLYNYVKVVSLTLGALALAWAVRQPTTPRLALLAASTVIAGLFRHDYGVYVAIGSLVALTLSEGTWTTRARRLAVYGAASALFVLPSLIWITNYTGIPQYITDALSGVGEEDRRLRMWPSFVLSNPLAPENGISFTYYAFWAAPLVACVLLVVVALKGSSRRGSLAIGAGLAAMALACDFFFLRSNLPARYGDAIVPVALVTAWAAGLPAASSRGRAVALSAVGVLLVVVCAAFAQMNSLRSELASGRLSESVSETRARFSSVVEELAQQPPSTWPDELAGRRIDAARYLAECTAPDDRVLLAAPVDEVVYFARRTYGAGQRRFNGILTSEIHQQRAIERLKRQSVPVVLTEPALGGTLLEEYPLLSAYIESHYRDVGAVLENGTPALRVWVENSRTPERVHPEFGLPCFR